MTNDSHLLESILFEFTPMVVAFLAPLWVPGAILISDTATAPSIWRFSLRFLTVLTLAEGAALAAAVAIAKHLFQ
jgi:hypothetical protein